MKCCLDFGRSCPGIKQSITYNFGLLHLVNDQAYQICHQFDLCALRSC